MKFANHQPIMSEGIIMLHLRIDDLCMRVWFGLLTDVAVDVLLDT